MSDSRKTVCLCLIALIFGVMGIVLPEIQTGQAVYINATWVNQTGLASFTCDVANLSDINVRNCTGVEGNSPWNIDITFTNVTNFSYVELKQKYFSTVGVSTHVNDVEIYCETEKAFVDLETFTNEIEWWYYSRNIADDMHFLQPNGNVTIRINHTSNGNTNHRIILDTVRLIEKPTFEQNNINLTQQFITNNIIGQGISFAGQSVDLNGSILHNGSLQNSTIKNITITGSGNGYLCTVGGVIVAQNAPCFHNISNPILSGTRPYVLKLDINQSDPAPTDILYGTTTFTNSLVFNTINDTWIHTNMIFYINDTQIPFWFDNISVSNKTARIWVNLTINGTVVLYVDGNYSKNNTASGKATFMLFDDFSDNILDTTLWNSTGEFYGCTPIEKLSTMNISCRISGTHQPGTDAGLGGYINSTEKFGNISLDVQVRKDFSSTYFGADIQMVVNSGLYSSYGMWVWTTPTDDDLGFYNSNGWFNGVYGFDNTATDTVFHDYTLKRNGTTFTLIRDNNIKSIQTNAAIGNTQTIVQLITWSRSTDQDRVNTTYDNVRVRPYQPYNEPAWTQWV